MQLRNIASSTIQCGYISIFFRRNNNIIKIAMRRVQEELLNRGYQSKLMLQVHDELDFSVPENEVEEITRLVKEIMENVVELKVPLVVDVSAGSNWAQAH